MSLKSIYSLAVILICSLHATWSQVNFEEGYYVNNEGEKTSGFIKNLDWENNPTEFEFSKTLDGTSETLTTKSVSEFSVKNGAKYVRYKVPLDRSSDDMNRLSSERSPSFTNETLFLKSLVEGNYTLFEFVDRNLRRFFYQKNLGEVEQLVYKRFKLSEYEIGENRFYRQQLKLINECSEITEKELKKLQYEKNSLKGLFVKLNKCSGSESLVEFDKKRTVVNFYLKGGVSTNSFEIIRETFSGSEFDKVSGLVGYRLGVEIEFVLPFNKNKWAAVLDPNYRTVSDEPNLSNDREVVVDFTSLEIPIGIRHYMFMNDNSKLFVDGFLNVDFSSASNVSIEGVNDYEGKTSQNFGFGAGYNYKNLFSLALRVETPQDLLDNFTALESRFWSTSVIIGVRFL